MPKLPKNSLVPSYVAQYRRLEQHIQAAQKKTIFSARMLHRSDNYDSLQE